MVVSKSTIVGLHSGGFQNRREKNAAIEPVFCSGYSHVGVESFF